MDFGLYGLHKGENASPRPVQRPHPPIVIGGESRAAYRRAAREGSGWYGWELTPEQVAHA